MKRHSRLDNFLWETTFWLGKYYWGTLPSLAVADFRYWLLGDHHRWLLPYLKARRQ